VDYKELVEAIKSFNQEKIQAFIIEHGINYQFGNGDTALHIVIRLNTKEASFYTTPNNLFELKIPTVLKSFHFIYSQKGINLTLTNMNGDTPFHLAISNNNAIISNKLLQLKNYTDSRSRQTDEDKPSSGTMCGNTEIHFAVLFNSLSQVKYFVEKKKININTKNDNGDTPLFLAYKKDPNSEVTGYLLQQPDIDATITNNQGQSVVSLINDYLTNKMRK